VAEGRRLPRDNVSASAEGQVFAGVEAKARGLVDVLGGLDAALRVAADLAALPPDTPIEVVDAEKSLFELLGDDGTSDAAERRGLLQAARTLIEPATRPLLDVPEAWPEAIAFIDSLSPLLGRTSERTACSMPFALSVR
jgi:protease-4